MLKIMFVGDLHLLDREIGATRGYAEESDRNLIKIRDEFRKSDCDFIVLGGDIQHALPEDIQKMSGWRKILNEIRDDVYDRMVERDVFSKIKVELGDGSIMDFKEESVLFSLKGNHDYNKRKQRVDSFTYFDDLVESKTISVPQLIMMGKVQLNLYSSQQVYHPIEKREGVETVVGAYHDPIIKNGVLVDTYMGNKMISPDNHHFFNGVDLAIINDIHLPIEPYDVTSVDEDKSVGYRTHVVTLGSMGRTSYNDSHKRDEAYFAIVDVGESGEVTYDMTEVSLLPYKELFDYEKVIKVKKRENMFDQFSLEIEKIDKVKRDPREDIRNMDIEDEDVKEKCLSLLEEVMGGDKS